MNYEVFKKKVANEIIAYMPEEYRECSVQVNKMKKVNETLDSLNVYFDTDEESTISPNIYIDYLYNTYKNCRDFELVMKSTAKLIDHAFKNYIGDVKQITQDSIEDKIVMVLVNTLKNKELLEDVPHRQFMDLSIIYRIIGRCTDQGIDSAILTYNLFKEMGITEEKLYDLAVTNTKRMFPSIVKPLRKLLIEMYARATDEEQEVLKEGIVDQARDLYVITNSKGYNGSNGMLNDEVLYKLSCKLNSNLYILPSSIHEVMAISDKLASIDELYEMVRKANAEVVEVEDKLADSVYFYDRVKRDLHLVVEHKNSYLH